MELTSIPEGPQESHPFAVVDIETTGFSPRLHDRILEISIVRTAPDGRIEDEYATLVNAGRDVGPVHVHGITARDILNAPHFRDLIGDISERLEGAVLVAHNARFDRGFLQAEFSWAGQLFPPTPTLCTLHLAWLLYPNLGSHRLMACCAHVGINQAPTHAALEDARADALLLAAYLIEARRRGLRDLHALGCAPLSFDHLSWPDTSPCGRVLTREVAHLPGVEKPFLARVVSSLQHEPVGSPGIASYLDLLDRALEDRVITQGETEILLATAREWGLSGSDVVDAHRSYLADLARVDLADGVVSESEMRDLRNVCALLALDETTLDQALFGLTSGADVDSSLRQPVPAPPTLVGKKVCFTGTLMSSLHGEPITRERARELARAAGLDVLDGVTKTLDILVVADAATQSGKANKARAYGVRIMAEAAFWRDIGIQVE